MSLDNRNTSAQFKRAEQLKRWEESEMNKKLSGVPKSPSSRRIKFSSGCIFLAACVAGDKEEVEWLLKNGADIDTANVDGLTALHQACIDDNLDMVEFLVQKGADVNRKDNEGWTPLHATASCGFLSIARYLIENGADLASINSDGELAVDLASSDAMEDLIQHHLDEQGIDCDEARQAEERIMLSDATKWLRTDSSDCDKAHPKTGATAIHVAAAKGYIGVLKLLLEGRGDIDRQDVDGWTPLHAAAYWGQKEATQMLLNASADIDIQNYSGQLAIDIAQDDIVPLLKDARKNVKRTKRRPPSHGNRITDNFENSTETPTKVIRVEMKPIDSNKEKEEVSEKENKPTEPDVILRRTQSFESDEKFYQRYAELRARIQANSCPHTILPSTPINTKTSTASNNNNNNNNNSSNTNNNNNNNTTTTTASAPASNISSYLVQRSASLKDHRTLRKTASNLVLGSTTTSPSSATPTTTTTTTTGPASGVPTNTSIVPPATGTTTAVSQAAGNTTVSSGAVSSPPTSPSGTPTTTPTAGQIRSSIPTPVTTTTTTTNNKNIMLNSNTDNSSSTPFGDRYRKRYEDQPEVVRKPPQTNNHNNNGTIADHHTTTTSVAGDVLPTTGSGGGGNNATTTAATTGTDTSKNHSLFELNRKYIEQAQKTKINNERNKFLSSLNEKRQQQLQEQQGQSGGGTAGRTEATQAQASIEEPAEVKLIISTSTAAAPTPPTVDAHNATATTPVTTSPSSNKLSPGNIFKNFFKSFVPPTRDEESETQRKAHAKRVRETRRSTQGVTLDEIKSAEQLVKKKNASGAGNENDTMASATSASTTTTTSSSPSSLSSSASPSFTTNNATTISGTAAINDRVPSVGDTTDQQQSGGGGNHVSEGSGKDSGSEVAVSASFTIAAPSSALDDGGDGGGGGGHRRHRRSVGAGGGNDEEEDDIKVSYTISAPVRPSSPGRRATVNNSKESTTDPPADGSDILGGTDAEVPVVSATFHVPAVSEAGVVATTATIRTSGTAAGGVVSSSDSNTTTITNTTSASSNTNHNTAATYTKRSLFDIDNANSLTLAEKLRHEANKYAIAAVADGDLDSHSAVPRVPNSNSTTTNSGGESNSNSTNAPADNSAVSAAAAAVPPSPTFRKPADSGAASTTAGVTAERRPSWRLKVDGGSKFKLEDASTPNAATQSSSVASGSVYESVPATQATEHGLTTTKLTSSSALAQRRAQQQNGDSTTTTTTTGSSVAGSAIGSRPLSASGLAAGEQYNRVPGSNASSAGEPTTAANTGTDTSPLHHLRRPPKSTTAGEENKENDKENDSRTSSTTAQATQAVIQRRRRQKRRSTGVVSVGIEDLDPDRQDSPVDGEDKETGSERGRSRVGSTASELDTANQPQDSTRENGGDCIDYKALYEQEKADNDKLKMSLRKKDEEVVTLKAALDRFTTATTKNNSLSELEKRERRAMERKMSEMEEELKLLEALRTENQRLKDENGALIRVISKLSR